MHFHIVTNTPGYLPESDPITLTTRRDAEAALAAEAKRFRDDQADLPRQDRRTGTGSAKSGGYFFSCPSNIYDLGVRIDLTTCQENDCLKKKEN